MFGVSRARATLALVVLGALLAMAVAAPTCTDDTDCNGHGKCDSGKCFCSAGWTGMACDVTECALNCYGHGKCSADGVCECYEGWDGEYCDKVPDAETYRDVGPVQLGLGVVFASCFGAVVGVYAHKYYEEHKYDLYRAA